MVDRNKPLCVILPIHEGGDHWALGVVFAPNKVLYLDSCYSISGQTKATLLYAANLINKTGCEPVVEVQGLEKQTNNFDCGLFTLEYMQLVLEQTNYFSRYPEPATLRSYAQTDMPIKRLDLINLVDFIKDFEDDQQVPQTLELHYDTKNDYLRRKFADS